jgi:hypothetical protein
MSVKEVANQRLGIIKDIGMAGLHALYPDEFEYYACSFELLDSKNNVKAYFLFPVMPTSISTPENKLVNIKKTSAGVVSLFNTSFNPVDISLAGTFGRKLRIMIGQDALFSSAFSFSVKGGKAQFSSSVKTGYGAMKYMEDMFDKAMELDEFRRPHRLFFYNPTLNNNYLVEILNFTPQMSMENNMLWNYSINMKALAPAELVDLRTTEERNKSNQKLLGFSLINKSVNKQLSVITDLNKQLRKEGLNFISNSVKNLARKFPKR